MPRVLAGCAEFEADKKAAFVTRQSGSRLVTAAESTAAPNDPAMATRTKKMEAMIEADLNTMKK